MDSPAIVIILLLAFGVLIAIGYRGLHEGLNDSAAFGAVCVSLATVLGCLLMLILYAETTSVRSRYITCNPT